MPITVNNLPTSPTLADIVVGEYFILVSSGVAHFVAHDLGDGTKLCIRLVPGNPDLLPIALSNLFAVQPISDPSSITFDFS